MPIMGAGRNGSRRSVFVIPKLSEGHIVLIISTAGEAFPVWAGSLTTILQFTSGRMGRITFFLQHLVFIVNLLVAFANGKFGGCFRLRKKQMLFMKIWAFFLLEWLFSVLFDGRRDRAIHSEKNDKWITLNMVLAAHQMEIRKKNHKMYKQLCTQLTIACALS